MERYYLQLQKEMARKTPKKQVVARLLDLEFVARKEYVASVGGNQEARVAEIFQRYLCFNQPVHLQDELRRYVGPQKKYFLQQLKGRPIREAELILYAVQECANRRTSVEGWSDDKKMKKTMQLLPKLFKGTDTPPVPLGEMLFVLLKVRFNGYKCEISRDNLGRWNKVTTEKESRNLTHSAMGKEVTRRWKEARPTTSVATSPAPQATPPPSTPLLNLVPKLKGWAARALAEAQAEAARALAEAQAEAARALAETQAEAERALAEAHAESTQAETQAQSARAEAQAESARAEAARALAEAQAESARALAEAQAESTQAETQAKGLRSSLRPKSLTF
uniref:Uncharacterized protein n=1 Tax=Branchiostoma floridae TaxID=7739 RepID=C3Z162_BRAFL|eukprot:XP_002597749.1 hypothetical protein BRAFLDRAFT_77349 [Branchiostoma floridae]